MKLIKLTQNQYAKVSDSWFDYLSQWKWQAQWNKHTQSYYAVRALSNGESILMSRVIASTPVRMICDHINHDTLDNQPYNLRNVRNIENQWNSNIRKDNKLGYKNIRVQKSGRFQVRIKSSGKTVFDKTFPTLMDAIRARNDAINRFHGEFGNTGELQ